MPITVRHDAGDGDLSALTGLAALAGAMQARAPQAPRVDPQGLPRVSGHRPRGSLPSAMARGAALRAAREKQIRDIEARADLEKQSADDAMKRTALEAGLGQQMQEQEYDLAISKMQEQAKIAANQFEYKFDAGQRQEIARLNNARRAVQSSTRFSPEEKEIALRQIDMQQAQIEPSAFPADPNKLQFEEGKEPGKVWRGEDGSILTTDPETGMSKLIQRWDQGPEAAEMEARHDLMVKQLDARQRFEDELWKTTIKDPLTGKEVFLPAAEVQRRIKARYGDGSQVNPEEQGAEVQQALHEKYGYEGDRPLPLPPQSPEQPQQPVEPTGEESQWWSALESQGIPVSQKRKEMPLKQGSALSLYDVYRKQYKSYDEIPDELKPAYNEIRKVVEEYYGR